MINKFQIVVESAMNPQYPEKSIPVSIILPVLNEELTIANCTRKIKIFFIHNSINGEISIADSPTDRPAGIAQPLGATVIPPEKPGYGNAYLPGFAHAKGRYIVLGDVDDTYDFPEIPKLLAPLEAGADFIIGSLFS